MDILHRYTNAVLWHSDLSDVRDALVEAVKQNASLSGANLSGADLHGADLHGANLSGADLSRATLSWATLSRANLSGAYLSGANLHGADLSGAYLSGANLSGANLSWADLHGADGINSLMTSPLRMLRMQPGQIRACKLVTAEMQSPMLPGGATPLTYALGAELSVFDANTDETEQCAAGINLASQDWCLREWKPGYRIMLCEFTAEDIAAIPIATDGKFRVRRCKVVDEWPVSEWGEGQWSKPDHEEE